MPHKGVGYFSRAVAAAVAGLDQGGRRFFSDLGLDLERARKHQPRLVGHRQALKDVLHKKGLHQIRQIRRRIRRRLKTAGKRLSADRLGQSIAARLDPDAPAWQLAPQVGRYDPVGRQHEAQQFVGGKLGAGYDAGPLRPLVLALVLHQLASFSHCAARFAPTHRRSPSLLFPVYPSPPSASESSLAGAASIQPAWTRAAMIMASASSRLISMPSR